MAKKQSNGNSAAVTARYVGRKAVASYTSLGESTIYEWAGNGKIPSIKIGRRVLFDLHDIDKLMSGLKRNYNQEEKTVNEIVRGINDNDI